MLIQLTIHKFCFNDYLFLAIVFLDMFSLNKFMLKIISGKFVRLSFRYFPFSSNFFDFVVFAQLFHQLDWHPMSKMYS